MGAKIGVFGAGIGKFAIEGVLRRAGAGAQLAVVVDSDPGKWSVVEGVYQKVMADCPGLGLTIPAQDDLLCDSWQEAIEQRDLDAVIIALPTSLHAEVTIASLEAGLHVLCEKPMANSPQAAESMLEAARAHPNQIDMMVMNNLLRPHYRILEQLVHGGEVAQIQSIEAWWTRSRGRPFRGSAFTSREGSGAGPTVDLGVHLLYMVLKLLYWQKPTWVTGFTWADFQAPYRGEGPYGGGTKAPDAPIDVEDSAQAVFTFVNESNRRIIPVTINVGWVKNTPEETMGLTVYGTNSSVTMRRRWPINDGDDNNALDLLAQFGHRAVGPDWYDYWTELDSTTDPKVNDVFMGRVPMAEHFVEVVLGETEPLATFEEAILTQRMLEGWLTSALTGAPYQFEQQ